MSLLNVHGAIDERTRSEAAKDWETDDPLENIHGDRPFLVKLQRPASLADAEQGRLGLMVYDRGRSVKGYIMMKGNEEFWNQAVAQMPYGSVIAKVYRWAQRTGDWKLSVCVDREPLNESLLW